jgi:hypothetical protein
MPLPFIIAGLAAIAGAATTTAAAVGTAAATVAGTAAAMGGAAVAAGAAAVGTLSAAAVGAAAVIGALTIGGISISTIVAGASLIFSVLRVTVALLEKFEAAKSEGAKKGYVNASREYEGKLREKADAFLKKLKDAIDQPEIYKQQKDKAEALAEEAYSLLGEYEGCIVRLKEDGKEPLHDTEGMYLQLQRIVESLPKAA